MASVAYENVLERQCLTLQIETEPRFVSGFRKCFEDGDHISSLLPVSVPPTQRQEARTGQFSQPDLDMFAFRRYPTVPRVG